MPNFTMKYMWNMHTMPIILNTHYGRAFSLDCNFCLINTKAGNFFAVMDDDFKDMSVLFAYLDLGKAADRRIADFLLNTFGGDLYEALHLEDRKLFDECLVTQGKEVTPDMITELSEDTLEEMIDTKTRKSFEVVLCFELGCSRDDTSWLFEDFNKISRYFRFDFIMRVMRHFEHLDKSEIMHIDYITPTEEDIEIYDIFKGEYKVVHDYMLEQFKYLDDDPYSSYKTKNNPILEYSFPSDEALMVYPLAVN